MTGTSWNPTFFSWGSRMPDKKHYYRCSCEAGVCFLNTNTTFLPDHCLTSTLPKGLWLTDECGESSTTAIDYHKPVGDIKWERYPVRIVNELIAHNVTTLERLLELSAVDLLRMKNIGLGCLLAIKETLENMGIAVFIDKRYSLAGKIKKEKT